MDTYSVLALGNAFQVHDTDGLFREIESTDYGVSFAKLGYLTIASDYSGKPLLLEVTTGKVFYLEKGRLAGDDEVELAKQLHSFPSMSLPSFFNHAIAETKSGLIRSLWSALERDDISFVRHVLSLEIDLEVVNAEGLSLVEKARLLDKKRLLRILERHR